MTRDALEKAFIDRYQDEAIGLFVRAYADVRPLLAEKNDARIGWAMVQQMHAARALLKRIFNDEHPAPAEPSPTRNGPVPTTRK